LLHNNVNSILLYTEGKTEFEDDVMFALFGHELLERRWIKIMAKERRLVLVGELLYWIQPLHRVKLN